MRSHHACGCLGSLDEFLGVVFEVVLLGENEADHLGVEDDSVRELLFETGASDSSGGAPAGKLFDSSLPESSGGGGALDFCADTDTTSFITEEVEVVE